MFPGGAAFSNGCRAFYAVALLIVCALLGGCGLFSPKPALPRQASSTANGVSDNTAELIAAVRRADIIYFPIEGVGAPLAEQPVWKIMEALKRNESSFSIAWQAIGTEQQSILDEIAGKPGQLEDALNRLNWDGARQTREYSKSILRATPGIRQLALGAPIVTKARVQSGSRLNSDERAIVPRGYRAPANGLEDFAEQFAATRHLREREIANLYHAHLFAEQFAAERIVTFMREHEGTKLLVFLRGRELGGHSDLAYFVAQKLKLGQIKLDRSPRGRAHLITSSRAGACSFSWL